MDSQIDPKRKRGKFYTVTSKNLILLHGGSKHGESKN